MTADEALSVSDVIASLRAEVLEIRRRNEKLEARVAKADESWATLRDVLDLGPGDSVLDAVEKLLRDSERRCLDAVGKALKEGERR
jgi:hypothetical protein